MSQGALGRIFAPLGIAINLGNIASTIQGCLTADARSGGVSRINAILTSALESVREAELLATEIDSQIPVYNQGLGNSLDVLISNGLGQLGANTSGYVIDVSSEMILVSGQEFAIADVFNAVELSSSEMAAFASSSQALQTSGAQILDDSGSLSQVLGSSEASLQSLSLIHI